MSQEVQAMQAIHAKCAHCMAKYRNKKLDCLMPDCPLYAFRPNGKAQERECVEEAS